MFKDIAHLLLLEGQCDQIDSIAQYLEMQPGELIAQVCRLYIQPL